MSSKFCASWLLSPACGCLPTPLLMREKQRSQNHIKHSISRIKPICGHYPNSYQLGVIDSAVKNQAERLIESLYLFQLLKILNDDISNSEEQNFKNLVFYHLHQKHLRLFIKRQISAPSQFFWLRILRPVTMESAFL